MLGSRQHLEAALSDLGDLLRDEGITIQAQLRPSDPELRDAARWVTQVDDYAGIEARLAHVLDEVRALRDRHG